MIHHLTLRNFQSHRASDLFFHPGVNAIVGSSNHGKSAIIRGLLWAKDNRPSGTDFVSHWNLDKKGTIKTPTSVTIGFGGVAVGRIRSKDFNGYEIYTSESEEHGSPEKVLEAIGTDVPDEIAKAFNMSEVNVQRQMDAPFLLSASPPDVARFFNSIIRLDIIDRVLGAAEGKRRKILAESKEVDASITQTQKQLKATEWIEEAQGLLSKRERVQARHDERAGLLQRLSESITSYDESRAIVMAVEITIEKGLPVLIKLDKLYGDSSARRQESIRLQRSIEDFLADSLSHENAKKILKGDSLFQRAIQIQAQIDSQTKEVSSLKQSITEYEDLQAVTRADWLPRAEGLCDKRDRKNIEVVTNRIAVQKMRSYLEGYADLQATIQSASENITLLSDSLPDTCPLCGAPMKKGEAHESHN